MNDLADFSDVKIKYEEYGSIRSKNQSKEEFDLDLDNNEKLLKNFKNLKDKLKELNR